MPNFLDGIGHEFDVFFGSTLPNIGREVGGFVKNTTLDFTDTVGKGVNNLLKPILGTATEVAQKTLESGGKAAKDVAGSLSSVLGNLQMPLIVGAIAVAVLLIYKS